MAMPARLRSLAREQTEQALNMIIGMFSGLQSLAQDRAEPTGEARRTDESGDVDAEPFDPTGKCPSPTDELTMVGASSPRPQKPA